MSGLSEQERNLLVEALHAAETTGGFWGEHPECQEFANVVQPAVERILADRAAAQRALTADLRCAVDGETVDQIPCGGRCHSGCRAQAESTAALVARVAALADRLMANGCNDKHQQAETDECNGCTGADFAALLAPADAPRDEPGLAERHDCTAFVEERAICQQADEQCAFNPNPDSTERRQP